jgi:hypothetical protein
MNHTHASHQEHDQGTAGSTSWLKPLAIGTALAAGAVILAPYVLPVVGIGNAALAEEAMVAMHGTGLGVGLAGSINSVVNAIPLIGGALAKGGLLAAAAGGIIGIGGVLLGQHMQKKEDGSQKISWGKVVTTAALLTSALIALPTVLTGISVGIVYMCAAFSGVALASSALGFLAKTLGAVGSMNVGAAGMTGAFAAIPHLLTCGASVIPAALTLGMMDSKKPFTERVQPVPMPENNPDYSDGSIQVQVDAGGPLVAGKPARLRLHMKHTATNLPVTADELAVVETKIIHLFVVDQSLKDYHHIHPTPTSVPGVYEVEFTPKTSNNYSAWSHFTMANADRKPDEDKVHWIKNAIPGALKRNVPAYVAMNNEARPGELAFSWKAEPPLRKGVSSVVTVHVTDAMGNPISDLQPTIGAFAHMMGFSADGKSVVHSHPMGMEPTSDDQRAGPTLRFHVEPDNSGPMQFYVQVMHKGRDVFASFGQQIQDPARTAARMAQAHHRPHADGMSPGFAL